MRPACMSYFLTAAKVICFCFRYIKYRGRASWPDVMFLNLISFNHGWYLCTQWSCGIDAIFLLHNGKDSYCLLASK